MAKKTGVWGIDIGQCALKALYCTMDGGEVVAEAFDYIEYPKILSQPEADADELVGEALEQFLSRNEVKGNTLAISVPGQAGLARFFKPPPVDAKKIPEIVKYEAKQQIPFDLEEVIWDFQKMSGGQEVDGFALDAEVGLFAMKREQVYNAIEPFAEKDLELDIIQLAPLCIYNFVAYDLLRDGPEEDEYDPDDPPESLVVLSMGTETTDLVVTNGFRVWQRSIPIGGNHFTKQLTKELKLTFAKAEHLKRNARQAEDPKTVFQAMRPVFNDLVTEIQRSIGYFQGIDRQAKIKGAVILGNTVKLPGLQHYLSKNLGYEVVDFRKYETLTGDSVLSAPPFKDNVLGFGVCYGLCLQGLGKSRLRTNLVPREILINRLVKAKKPWAVAGVASLMMACAVQYFFPTSHWHHVKEGNEHNGVSWKVAQQKVTSAQTMSSGYVNADTERLNKIKQLTALGEEVVGSSDRRLLWLEFMHALNAALDSARTKDVAPGAIPDIKEVSYDKRKEMFISSMESQYFTDLTKWFSDQVRRKYEQAKERGTSAPPTVATTPEAAAAAQPAPATAAPDPADPAAAAQPGDVPPADAAVAGDPSKAADGQAAPTGDGQPAPAAGGTATPPATAIASDSPTSDGEATADAGPTGAGWVIELEGYHLYNSDNRKAGDAHVNETLIEFLTNGTIRLPVKPGATETEEFSMQDLGIGYAIIASENQIEFDHKLPNPEYEGDANAAGGGNGGAEGDGGFGGDDGADGGGGAFDGGGGAAGGLGGAPAGAGGGLGGAPGGGPPGGFGGSGGSGSFGGSGGGAFGGSGGAAGGAGGGDGSDPDSYIVVPRYSFTIQFCWQEQLLTKRLEKIRAERAEKKKQEDLLKAQQQQADEAAGNVTEGAE